MTASLRPVFLNARLLWLEFLLANLDPMAPQLPALVLERNELERERKGKP